MAQSGVGVPAAQPGEGLNRRPDHKSDKLLRQIWKLSDGDLRRHVETSVVLMLRTTYRRELG